MKTGRVQGNGTFAFLEVSDGSCAENLQVGYLLTQDFATAAAAAAFAAAAASAAASAAAASAISPAIATATAAATAAARVWT